MYQICPRCVLFHANAEMLVMKIFGGIIPRCFHINVKRTIPRLTYKLRGKNPIKISQLDDMAWDEKSELLVVPTRWAILDAPYMGPHMSWCDWR